MARRVREVAGLSMLIFLEVKERVIAELREERRREVDGRCAE